MAKKGKVGRKVAAKVAKVETKGARIPLKTIVVKSGFGDGSPESTKRARVKLRRVWRRDEETGAVSFHSKGSRWDLTAKEAKEVSAILAG